MLTVLLGYYSVLGEINHKILSLDTKDLGRVGEMGEVEEFSDVEIDKAMRFINLQDIVNQDQEHQMYYKHTKMRK